MAPRRQGVPAQSGSIFCDTDEGPAHEHEAKRTNSYPNFLQDVSDPPQITTIPVLHRNVVHMWTQAATLKCIPVEEDP